MGVAERTSKLLVNMMHASLLVLVVAPLAHAFHLHARPVATHHVRTSRVICNEEKVSDPHCTLLSDEVRRAVNDLLDTPEDEPVIACDDPIEDPSLTCFLTPDSWLQGTGLTTSTYLCFSNPEPWAKSYKMSS